MHRLQQGELPSRDHRLATAAAAVADETDAALDVLAELHEILFARFLQQVEALRRVDLPRDAVAGQRLGHGVERHADVHRRVARRAEMLLLVAAVAHPDPDVLRALDHPARAFVVEDLERAVGREHTLVDERAPELGLAVQEQGANELLLDLDVLLEQLGQQPLVEIVSDPHHRELEEAGHRRGQHVRRLAVATDVEQDPPRRQRIEGGAGLGLGNLPARGGLRGEERLDRELRDEASLALAEQQPEDAVQQLRGRSALREPVDPVHQRAVRVSNGQVRQWNLAPRSQGILTRSERAGDRGLRPA